jgi:Putative beta-barrel porin-2, OmpL-like. bbp2
MFRISSLAVLAALSASPAVAQDAAGAEPSAPSTAGPAEQDAPSVTPPTTPGMTGPLLVNPKPLNVDGGPLGKVYITGAVTGVGLWQNHAFPGDHTTRGDLSNGQVFVQTTEGPIQFFVQAGVYSLPSLGTAYFKASDMIDLTYGVVPQAFIKVVPLENFNIMVGKLPTLMGAEYTFTFENMNINRGLLWNQENAVNRGVQANYSKGPLSVSLSFNDGYYSKKYNWLSGLVSYAVTPHDTISVVATGNVGRTKKTSFATPLAQNNGQLLNLIWTHNAGRWTITPYLQYTHVPKDDTLGIAHSASTYGAAILAKYSFTPQFSLAGRAEYINSSGSVSNGAPSLLYGPGSNAWSLTLTPTYQRGIYFVRGEGGYLRANNITSGSALGPDFNDKSQTRAMIETGITF